MIAGEIMGILSRRVSRLKRAWIPLHSGPALPPLDTVWRAGRGAGCSRRALHAPAADTRQPDSPKYEKPALLCKGWLAMRCREGDGGWYSVPVYDRATSEVGAGSPAAATRGRVFPGVVRRQMQGSPHVHGIGGARRDQHLTRQRGANREGSRTDGRRAARRSREGAMIIDCDGAR